ncbi:MAG TPA: patatin-like phospholipase family protein, partial [Verrucomicrobiales bacterium]|nr:patatin-like phospholipase family protein [Verrucomicrobiales bacterium]
CFSLKLLGTVVVAYGPDRTGLEPTKWVEKIRDPTPDWIKGYGPWALLGVLMVIQCIRVSAKSAIPGEWRSLTGDVASNVAPMAELAEIQWGLAGLLALMAALGLLVALALYVFVLWVHRRGMDHPETGGGNDPALYADPKSPQWLATTFQNAAKAEPWEWINWIPGKFGCFMAWLVGPEGYCDPKTGKLRSGHRLAILLALALVVLYLVIYWLGPLLGIEVPVLVYLTIFVLVMVWWLNACAFALDRFRIPVFVPLLVLVLISRFLPWTQYRFRSEPYPQTTEEGVAEEKAVPGPEELLSGDEDSCPVVVAAEGGGIHSGAWAVHVLRTLEKECRGKNLLSRANDSFAKHVVCVSGVSGGSYGLMYWVDSYQREGGPAGPNYDEDTTLNLTEGRAVRSSLGASIRGLVYHDIWRTFFPVLPGQRDRGSLLEDEWVKPPAGMSGEDQLAKAGMSSWRTDAKAKRRPAVLFNCMNADNGQPVVFATTHLADEEDTPYWEYRRQRPGEDVPVVTAARCSASFPFVCPAAAPATDKDGLMHLVDGGYYDNYGMASLNRWLSLAAKHWEAKARGEPQAQAWPDPPKRLLVVQVRASSESLFAQMLTPEWNGEGHTGFLYQAGVPLTGLLKMRSAAQTWHNDSEYANVVRRLEAAPLNIKVRTAVFRFPGMDNPLSWHLTTSQKQAVRNVTFEKPPEEPPKRYESRTKPRNAEEEMAWAKWTRYAAQHALHESWGQVEEHFRPKNPAP